MHRSLLRVRPDLHRLRGCLPDICDVTGRVLSRQTGWDANLIRSVLETCRAACQACGEECARHADMHEHCTVCAEACRRCEQACAELLATLA